MTPEEIRALYVARAAAFAARDISALCAAFSEDCVVETPDSGQVIGRAAIEERYRKLFASVPDVRIEAAFDLVAMGDQVVVVYTVSGTNSRGKRFSLPSVNLVTFQDGRIVRERRVNDFLLHRIEGELETAAEIQQALLPDGRYEGIGFEAAAVSVPCRAIGGDFFDYFDLSTEVLGFVLGDVAGKGPPAALLAAELQGILASYSYLGGSPAETVTHVNNVLMRRPIDSRFVTLLYGALSSDGRLTYCNAGHNPPLVIGRSGMRRLVKGGLIAGAFKQAIFEEDTVQLAPGDGVVAYSDGVTEALNAAGDEFGEQRLISCVDGCYDLSASQLLERVSGTVRDFSAGVLQTDDLTILVVRYTGQ